MLQKRHVGNILQQQTSAKLASSSFFLNSGAKAKHLFVGMEATEDRGDMLPPFPYTKLIPKVCNMGLSPRKRITLGTY